ncbi:FAD:protein FMN transferase [Bifidobacterium catulorum]|uniref:FAD:protein FMN transferase n=1 Tax=Bifidobacterium catulorum TaxID=1630173 RepID=A0A2U2MS02_9BIFI|nr:FAD:protein FMN transferase [Bifidobacterium catulorum]PWG59620.1 FAD:protein FMN transferase [Bifidobacterium catulorum]
MTPTRGPAIQAVIQARVIHAMTVPFTMQIVAGPQQSSHALAAIADEAITLIGKCLHDVETRFSPFLNDSLVAKARAGDWSALLHDRDFAEIYALCHQAKRLTDGCFDPMHNGVYDPTGIVKGWAIERAHQRFLMPLVRDGRCAAAALGGGGDIRTAVHDDSDFVWRIGIENPLAGGIGRTKAGTTNPRQGRPTPHTTSQPSTIRTISLRDGAIATSGTAKRGEHITRRSHDLAQATIIHDRLVFADMWATTAIIAGEQRFRSILATHAAPNVQAILARYPEYHADDDSLVSVIGFPSQKDSYETH